MTTAIQEIPTTWPAFTEASQVPEQSGSSLLKEKREQALKTYLTLPVPQPRDEEWRRTDPDRLPLKTVKPLAELKQVETVTAGEWDEHFDVIVEVTDTSFAIKDASGLMANETLVVSSLADAAVANPELIKSHLQGSVLPEDTDKFVSMNGAYWNVGLFIQIPNKVVLEKGILLRYAVTQNDSVLLPRLLVVAGEECEARIVEHYESPDDVQVMNIAAKELYLDRAARVQVLTMREWGKNTYEISNDAAFVQRDAQVDWMSVNFGSKLSKLMLGSDVAGPGSKAELDGLFFNTGDQHIAQKTLQIHSSPHTYSRLLYKGCVQDESRSVYRGVIQAKPGAIDVDAYQTNNNLILSDGARADTIPGLLIDADDLACSHGATIGSLDPEQLFYLRSRGLDEALAKKMCILGFYSEIIERVPYPFIQNRIYELIDKKLDDV